MSPHRSISRAGFTVLELLVAASILMAMFALMSSSARSSKSASVVSSVDVQYEARMRLSELVGVLEDGIEVVRPPSGATLDHFVVRDRRNHLLVGYTVVRPEGSELRLFRRDTSPGGRETSDHMLVPHVREVAFTALAPDLLQVRLVMERGGGSLPVLTAIRLRNAASEVQP